MIVNGLVLAAGLSRRMGALKPLLRIGDKTLIEHSVTSLLEGGAQSVTVVLGRGADKVKKFCAGHLLQINYVLPITRTLQQLIC